MVKRLLLDLVIFAVVVVLCVSVGGQSLGDVLHEAVWFYGILFCVGILLCVYIGWSLIRAMNPKSPKKDSDADKR